ncbi:hypothetical protein ACWEFL_13320 [Streptomyces sp. NPDC004838]
MRHCSRLRVCADERHPDWESEGPAGQGVEAVRPIRDEIESRFRAPLAGLIA